MPVGLPDKNTYSVTPTPARGDAPKNCATRCTVLNSHPCTRGDARRAMADCDPVDIEAVVAALSERFTPDEAALVEDMLRRLAGTIPDRQMLEEIGLALAIHRRQQRG